jgi:carbon-monoxide dehydrogenase medium subunit
MSEQGNLFRPSEYFRPSTVDEAVGILNRYDGKARILAGGTDLMTEKDPTVEALIDVSQLELDYIRTNGDGMKVGAATTFADIAASPMLSNGPFGVLAEAARQMGTPQIRNMATIGGNICAAVPCADSAPPLLVLGATLGIANPDGVKSVGIGDFFVDARETELSADEMLIEIRLPKLPPRTFTSFIKKGRVAVADLALVNVAVCLTLAEDGACQNVRIALGSVAPIPMRAKEAEAMLEGKQADTKLLEEVAKQASEDIKPISDVRASAEYRSILSRVIVEEAFREAIRKAETS